MITGKRLFGTNGIRGLANQELTPEFATKIGSAIGTFFNKAELILGHDARTSGPMLAKAVTAGLNATGCTVSFAGMAPTPALQYAVKNHSKNGGVIITASHNPPEYNGIKVLWNDGIEISREQEIKIEKSFFEGPIQHAKWEDLGDTQELANIVGEYVSAIKTHVDTNRIRKKKYQIVVDAANSVGALAAPYLLRNLGCRVTTINSDIDGTFPGRPPEPRPENLKNLALTVKALKADLGIAFDGDADRSVFVDEKGEIHPGDKTFALVEKDFLQKNKGEKIVTPVSSSTLVKDIADSYGGQIVWTKVGSVTVSQTMKKVHAKLGGEENGGIFYGPHIAVRDGCMATALILEIMSKTEQKLSRLLADLPRYFIVKDKIDCPESLKEKVLKKLGGQVENLETNTIDGIKIWFKDSSAILIRPSGTEPLYRLYAEAKTPQKTSQLINDYSSKLKKIITNLKT
jgi:phosphomannomutase / phosphoglucomutase